MELDELKRTWEDRDRALDASLRLNSRLLQESALDRTGSALDRLSRLLWFELLLNLLGALWVGSFVAEHLSEARFVVPALGIHLCAVALIAAAVRQQVALKSIDYTEPVVTIQKRLQSLRIERIRAAKWTFLLSPLLFTLLLVVTLEGLFRVDAYAVLGVGFLLANLAFGVFVLALGAYFAKRFESRLERSKVAQGFVRSLAGTSLTSALETLSALRSFEADRP